MRADERFGAIPKMALANADEFGAATSVADGDLRVSFADMADAMTTVARALIASGVQPGDRVGIWAPNSAVWIKAALGAQAAGAWLVPINTRFKADELAYIVEKAGLRLLFTVASFLDVDYLKMVDVALESAGRSLPVVIVPPPGRVSCPSWDEFLSRADTVSVDAVRDRIDALGPDDISDVMFTSGTTGFPKGVMLRHGTSLRAYESYNRGPRLESGSRHLVVVPFFHCFGYKAGWMLDLLTGATTYPLAVFEPEAALALVERERITHLDGPPTLFTTMLDHPSRAGYDLSSLRGSMVAAAAVPAELIVRLREEVGLAGAMTGYGLTEAHALVSVASPDDPAALIASTVGHPLPDVDVRIVDPDGRPVPVGETGEILVTGYTVMSGYYNDPEATAAVVTDGWLATGDIGFIGEDGCLRISDRKKDIFITGGFNVSPVEVEKALLRMDAVAEVAVVGMPDPRLGEVGTAFVVATPGARLTEDALAEYAREHLANFKVPRRFVIVEALPHNATGKVIKPELRRLLQDGSP
jgi:acyl-CoA synthetase (AMP-forming)/AMP-acid ligase II